MIYIYGAGSIGAYLGGLLSASGADVVLLGRERLKTQIADNGLSCSDYLKNSVRVSSSQIRVESRPDLLKNADLVLVTVKSGDTEAAAKVIGRECRKGTPVVSFQNGVRNAEILEQHCGHLQVIAGMVPFNVIQKDGVFHRGTEGVLTVKANQLAEEFHTLFARAGLALDVHPDMRAVLWGKLLGNLFNPINALGDRAIKPQLAQRPARLLLARCQIEALTALKKAGIKPKSFAKFPNWLLLLVLKTPDALYNVLSRGALQMDAEARSSMWQDFEAGRKTEIDYLNGEVIALADKVGTAAPVNRMVLALIRKVEQGGERDYSAQQLFDLCTKLDR